jgi:hypothetical protein
LIFQSELFEYFLAERIRQFLMTRYRGRGPVGRIDVNVVLRSGSFQCTAKCFECLDECLAFHAVRAITFVFARGREEGRRSLSMSW